MLPTYHVVYFSQYHLNIGDNECPVPFTINSL
jgi:hypothetical protein